MKSPEYTITAQVTSSEALQALNAEPLLQQMAIAFQPFSRNSNEVRAQFSGDEDFYDLILTVVELTEGVQLTEPAEDFKLTA